MIDHARNNGNCGAELPTGWAFTPVDDLLTIVRGVGFPASAKQASAGPGIVGCLRTTNVQATVEWADLWFIPEEYVRSPEQIVQRHDILISLANSYNLVGKVAQIEHVPERSTLGAFISAIRTPQGCDPRFIYYQLSSMQVQAAIRAMASTTTNISNVSTSKLGQLHLWIAPGAEQTRIADRIDELFTDLMAGVVALERVRKKLKRYRSAVLHAAVTGRLTSGRMRSWMQPANWRPIGEVIEGLEQGWSPKCNREPASGPAEWAVMTTTAVQPMRFDGNENKALPKELRPREDLELKAGEVLITRAGPRSRAGIACLIRATRLRLILCDKAYRFRCKTASAIGGYIEIALNARPIADAINAMKTGSSDSGLNLTQGRFCKLSIPLPPLAEQYAIVETVNEKLSQIDAMEAEVERGLARAARLRQAILKAAFAGKLVPQDPNDEPAAKLLERIKAERAAASQSRPTRPRRARKMVSQ